MVVISWTDWCDEVGVNNPALKREEKSDLKKLWNKTSKNLFGNKKQESPCYGLSEYDPTGTEKFGGRSSSFSTGCGRFRGQSSFYPHPPNPAITERKQTKGPRKLLIANSPKPAVVWTDKKRNNEGDYVESYPSLGYGAKEGLLPPERGETKKSLKKKKVIPQKTESENDSQKAGVQPKKPARSKPIVRFLENESTSSCKSTPVGPPKAAARKGANGRKNSTILKKKSKNIQENEESVLISTDKNNNNKSDSQNNGKNVDFFTCPENGTPASCPTSSIPPTDIPCDSSRTFSHESLTTERKTLQDSKDHNLTLKKSLKRSESNLFGHHMRNVSKFLTNPHFRLAERKKHDGNECYKAKEYRDALKLYTEAVELCPECAPYYSNRSACYMMLGKYAQALSDAREAVRLDSTFVKGYLRIAKCNIALGDANAALAVLRQASELDPGNKSIREEENNAQALMKCTEDADKAAFRKDYRMAIFHIDRALTLAAGCRSLKITKAEYLIFLHRYGDAQEIVNEILQFDSGNADAIYVRGMCLYYQNNHEAAFTHFQHVLRLAPDHKKAKDVYKKAKLLRQKKDEGNQAFNRGNLQGALTTYTEALAVDPNNVSTNSKLYCNRATVRAKLRNFEEAVDDCTAAINLDESYIKAYLRRAKCYQELEKHEEAVRDYEKVCKLDRNQENKRLLQEAKTLLKRSKWKDYYKILGVTKTASEDEIKKSYKKMALQHHPDRHASASDKEKHEHEVKFKEIGEAYTVLTDTKKKAMYDRGQDVNESDCGMFHDEVDPNQIFQAFFSQGGNNAFSFGGNGGFPGAGFSGGNFPGGFHFQFS